jgi:hypothetical protein
MPTGYTEAVKDGISFQEFALRCVRAMGVCITMRDEPSGAPIPERFEPDAYHRNALEEAKKELEEFLAITPEEIAETNLEQYISEVERNARNTNRAKELRVKYEAMLEQVQAYIPPTEEHEGFKKFMIDQLKTSIDHDCDTSYCSDPVRITDEQWAARELSRLRRNIDYHSKHYQEDVQRANTRTLWMQQFRESIGL